MYIYIYIYIYTHIYAHAHTCAFFYFFCVLGICVSDHGVCGIFDPPQLPRLRGAAPRLYSRRTCTPQMDSCRQHPRAPPSGTKFARERKRERERGRERKEERVREAEIEGEEREREKK